MGIAIKNGVIYGANTDYAVIAPVESSPAVGAHIVGEYILWDNNLYVVTTAIAVGDTLSTQTNLDNVTVAELLSGKQDKESGKGLSTNDFTTPLKEKLEEIDIGLWTNVNADWNATSGDAEILNKPTTLQGYGVSVVPAYMLDGVIDISHIPKGALERIHVVQNDTARFALTSSQVQNGDVVKVTATNLMFYVVDDTNLDSELGYEPFSASTAAAVAWSNVLDKPSTLGGYGISDAYTKDETYTKSEASNLIVAAIETGLTATANYAIGDYMIYDNALYRAITAISIGDTLTEDENIVETNVTDELKTKQKNLTFDSAPTQNSTNPVTSDGVYTALADKVDKENGKGLSANDFTNTLKTKLDNIEDGAKVNVNADWDATTGDAVILHKPTTVGGYGITDAYTKTEVDTALSAKADQSTTYTKTEVNGLIEDSEDATGLVDISEGTSKEPYLFRHSPFGDRVKESIIGGSVVWNQLVQNGNFENVYYWANIDNSTSFSVSNNVASIEITGSVGRWSGLQTNYNPPVDVSHKYILTGMIKTSNVDSYLLGMSHFSPLSLAKEASSNNWIINSMIGVPVSSAIHRVQVTMGVDYSQHQIGDIIQVKNVQLIDLTAMFGTTIADYIYSLEQGSAGDGVAFFRSLFPENYYPYCAGEIRSVEGLRAKETVGFNLWDGTFSETDKYLDSDGSTANHGNWDITNYIPVAPNITYYFKDIALGASGAYVCWYDADKNFVSSNIISGASMTVTSPANASFLRASIRLTVVDTCINLSDSSRNGEYVPYRKNVYTLDSGLTLRGVPKLDSNNKLYYDGDVYEADGKVTRKYGIVDLGSCDVSGNGQPYRFGIADIAYHDNSTVGNIICSKFVVAPQSGVSTPRISTSNWQHAAYYWDDTSQYSSAEDLKAAMSGVYLVYELATPTVEEATPFQIPQRVVQGGTERFVTDSIVPVGVDASYMTNRAERFDSLPDTATLDGNYMVRQEDGVMKLVDAEETVDEVASANGNPIVFETASAQIAKETKVTFAPIQDFHGYDHPWPAGGGKNLLTTNARTETFSGVTIVVNADGTILINGTSTENSYFRIATNMDLTISESIKYSVVSSNDSLFIQFGFDKKDSSIADATTAPLGTDLTINNPSNVSIVWVRLKNGATYNNVKVYPMIRLSTESDATFSPYSNICPISGVDEVTITDDNAASSPTETKTLTVPLPSTIYSGELDLEKGVLVVDMVKKVLDGTESWSAANNAKFYTAVHDMKKQGNYLNAIKADKLATVQDGFSYLDGVTAITGYYDMNNYYPNQNWIYVRISESVASVNDLKAWFRDNPVTVIYPLATPVNYQLTPEQLALFRGINTVSTNASKIRVTYRNGKIALMDDMPQTLAIEEAKTDAKLATVLGNFAEVTGAKATKNYGVGSYVILDGQLRKITTAVATNETISDSNSAVTNVGNEIAKLNTGSIIYGTNNSSYVEVQSETSVMCSEITLPVGRWLVIACGDWTTNTTGYRQISFGSGKEPSRQYTSTTIGIDKEAYQQIFRIFESSGESLKLYAYQNSGVSLNIYPYLYATKLV